MNTLEALFPEAAFVAVPEPADISWHGCAEWDGDDTRTNAWITFRRFGGNHRIEACGCCLGSELAYLHLGNPKPAFVRVEQFDETEVAA